MIFEFSPLLLAIAVSIIGTTLQVWHRHGGPSWMFSLGGFLFILGRLMIAALCASVSFYVLPVMDEMDGNGPLFVVLPALALLAIGAWSVFAVARAVYRDSFGAAQEEAARVHHGDA